MMDLQGITDTRTWCGTSENSKIAGWKPLDAPYSYAVICLSDQVHPSVKVALCIFYRAVRFIFLFYAIICGTRGSNTLTFKMNVLFTLYSCYFLFQVFKSLY